MKRDLVKTVQIQNGEITMNRIIWLLLLCAVPLFTFAQQAVVIDTNNIHATNYWMGKNLSILEDPEGRLTIEDILSHYQGKFQASKEVVPLLPDEKYFWIKIPILKKTHDDFSWLFECYDQTIDDVDFYFPDKNGKYQKLTSGELHPFYQKAYHHKNFLFDIKLEPNKEYVVYLRVKDKMKMAMIGAVRNQQSLLNYALSEYFYLSLFYGFVLCMILVTIAYYISTRKRIYFLYLLYILSVFFFTLCSDGLGFQYIWSEFPYLNNEIRTFGGIAVIVTIYFFMKDFLGNLKISKNLTYIIWGLIAIRFLDALLQITISKSFIQSTFVDISIRLLIFISIIIHYRQGNNQLRYVLIAMISVLIGYAVRELAILNFFPNNPYTIYMNLFGESVQMIFITIALSEQLKLQLENSIKTQEKAIEEMEKMNKETQSIKNNLQEQVNNQVAREKFLSEGVSKLNDIIAQYQQSSADLYQNLCSFLANQFGFGMVGFYTPDTGGEYVTLKAGYGLDQHRLPLLNQPLNHGLIGQCLKSQEVIRLDNIPKDFMHIESGLGVKVPLQVVIQPLIFNNKLVGIIEFATFHAASELESDLLNRIINQISSVLSYSLFSEVTSNMLRESQLKEDELRIKQEELNQQIEEMLATQEEFSRKEASLLAEIERLKKK